MKTQVKERQQNEALDAQDQRTYRAVCTECDYRGNERQTEPQATHDKVNHQSITGHVVIIEVSQ